MSILKQYCKFKKIYLYFYGIRLYTNCQFFSVDKLQKMLGRNKNRYSNFFPINRSVTDFLKLLPIIFCARKKVGQVAPLG